MTRLFLAGVSPTSLRAIGDWDWSARPLGLLASFAYPASMEAVASSGATHRMLDSGAFTAWTRGHRVDLDALVREATSGRWSEVVALDVIGDADASVRNAEAMRERVPNVVPVFHIGDPWEHLQHYVERFVKVGLSCRFGEPKSTSLRWLERCFSRAWPARFHSFGWVDLDALMRFPFESADAATWVQASAAYRNWPIKVRGRDVQRHLSVDGEHVPSALRAHAASTWRAQQQLEAFWSRKLEALRVQP